MPSSPTPIDAAPDVPDSSIAEPTFDAQYEAFNAWEKTELQPGINALATNVYNNALEAEANVVAAAAQVTLAAAQAVLAHNEATAAAAAVSVLGVLRWVSGDTYSIDQIRFSPIDNLSYRRLTAGAGATDPSADPTNWASTTPPLIPRVQVFAASGSWVCPAGVFRIKLTVVAGGGGSNTNTATNATCGGGGGGAAVKWLTVAPGVTYTVTVGAGGAGGSGASSAGSAGGTSSFAGSGITTVSATGGAGAAGNTAAGGTGSNGDLNIAGGAASSGGADTAHYQPGGASLLAMPAAYPSAGTGYGGGGGSTSIGSTAGNAGSAGVVTVEY